MKKDILRNVMLGVIAFFLIVGIAACGYIAYIKKSIAGTYYIQSIEGKYNGLSIRAYYDGNHWETGGVLDYFKGWLNVDDYLTGYDNTFAYIKIYEDGNYEYKIAGFTKESGEQTNSGKIILYKKNITIQQENYEITIGNGEIIVTDENFEMVFVKEDNSERG